MFITWGQKQLTTEMQCVFVEYGVMMDEVQVIVSDFSYVQARSRNYILLCCLYCVLKSFHNLLQYTKDVFIVFEDSSTSKKLKKYFLYAWM
jgi:hypothetical protein